MGHESSWVGANFDPGALRSFRELLSQPMYFNESFLQCELLGHFWHRPMNFLGRGGSWVVTHALDAPVVQPSGTYIRIQNTEYRMQNAECRIQSISTCTGSEYTVFFHASRVHARSPRLSILAACARGMQRPRSRLELADDAPPLGWHAGACREAALVHGSSSGGTQRHRCQRWSGRG